MPHQKLKPHFIFDENRLIELKRIAPEAFADGEINWDTLKEALGNQLEEDGPDSEHFGLFWPGKRKARQLASMPSKGTLIPTGEGIDEEATRNIFIEGENLEVLKLLQKSYANRIKMIYIDPPYNTGSDFVYEDDFKEPLDEYLRRTGQVDEEGKKMTTNTRADGRFHSKWLSMMYPRLRLARNLLKDDGVIFVSIDDNEVHNLRAIMNEVFGEENFLGTLVWQSTQKNDPKYIATNHENVIVFSKFKNNLPEKWRIKKEEATLLEQEYELIKKKLGNNVQKIQEEVRKLLKEERFNSVKHYNTVDKRGIYFPADISDPQRTGPKHDFVIHPVTKKLCKAPAGGYSPREEEMRRRLENDEIHFGIDETTVVCYKKYLSTAMDLLNSVYYEDGRKASKELQDLFGAKIFEFPKPVKFISRLVKFVVEENDLVLDFFAGSGTIGETINRINFENNKFLKYIAVQLPFETDEGSEARKKGYKNISEITVDRLLKVSRKLKTENSKTKVDLGFRVYKLTNSNYKQWNNYEGQSVKELEKQFDLFSSPLADGWKEKDLLTEIILLEGFPLDSNEELLKQYKKNKVHEVSSDFVEHKLLVCLDKKIDKETISVLALSESDIFICLDNAISDEAKVRLADKGTIKTI